MIVIPRVSDRIKIKVGEVSFLISPLSVEHKFKLMEYMNLDGGQDKKNMVKMSFYSVKYSLKGIDGVVDGDGKPYELQFGPDGSLTDDCFSEVMGLLGNDKLAATCLALAMGQDAPKIEGVEVEMPSGAKKKN